MARDIWIAATRESARGLTAPPPYMRGVRRQMLALAHAWRDRTPVDHVPPVPATPPAVAARLALRQR